MTAAHDHGGHLLAPAVRKRLVEKPVGAQVLGALDLEPDVGSIAHDIRALVPFVAVAVLPSANAVEAHATKCLACLQLAPSTFGPA